LHNGPLMAERTVSFVDPGEIVTPEQHRTEWVLPLLFVAALVLASVFATMGARVHAGELAGIDHAVRDFVLGLRSGPADVALEVITFLGSKYMAPLAALIAWYVSGRNLTVAALVLLTGYVSAEFVDVLKAFFAVVRPETGVLERDSSSFPSGHASGSTAIAVFLGIAVRHRPYARFIAMCAAAFAVMVAFSRVYLDQHWFSDVTGGMLIGSAIGLGFSALYEWYRRRSARAPGPSRY
jgi:undecaprenyl-diphosphatase